MKKPGSNVSEIRTLDQKADVPETPATEGAEFAPASVPVNDSVADAVNKATEALKEIASPAEQAALEDLLLRQANEAEAAKPTSDLGMDGSNWRLQQEIFQDACLIGTAADNRLRVSVKEHAETRHVEIFLIPAGEQLVFEADGKATELAASHKDSSFEVGMVASCHPGKWVDYLKGKMREDAMKRIDEHDASRFSPVDDSAIFA